MTTTFLVQQAFCTGTAEQSYTVADYRELFMSNALLASFVTTITRKVLTDEQVHKWAMCCPFLFSSMLAPVFYITGQNSKDRIKNHGLIPIQYRTKRYGSNDSQK